MPAPADPAPPSALRRAVLLAAVAAVVAVGGYALDGLFRPDRPPPIDFPAFWAAGRLNAHGENPYDPVLIRAAQRPVLPTTETATMMWNPPWVLTLAMPFGLLPFAPAAGAWAVVHIGLMIAAAELLWRGFAPAGPARGRRWVAYLVTLTFVPTTYLIGIGQITAVVLAGLAGFLVLSQTGRPLLAGAAGAVTAAKPHLLTVFAAWLLLDAAAGRFGRRVLLGGVLVGLAACLPPTATNPTVWGEYLHATTAPADADHYHLSNWATPVLASWLRRALPGQPFWVQFAAPAAAVLGFAVWYRTAGRGRAPGDPGGTHLLPWIVGLSLLVAPYGAWPFDLVLLLVPVLAVAARVAAAPTPSAIAVGVGWLAAVNAGLLAMMLATASSELYVWATPCILVGCVVTRSLAGDRAAVPAPAGA